MNISKGWYCCSSAPAWKKNLKARVWWWWVYFFSCSSPHPSPAGPSSCFSLVFQFSCTHLNLRFLSAHSLPPARTPHGPSFLSHIPHSEHTTPEAKRAQGRVHPKPLCPRLAPSWSSPCESTFTSENAKITVLMALWIRNSWNISNISQQKSRVIENKWWQEGNREIGKGNLGLYRLRQKKKRERDNKARRQKKSRKMKTWENVRANQRMNKWTTQAVKWKRIKLSAWNKYSDSDQG